MFVLVGVVVEDVDALSDVIERLAIRKALSYVQLLHTVISADAPYKGSDSRLPAIDEGSICCDSPPFGDNPCAGPSLSVRTSCVGPALLFTLYES